MRHGGRVGEGGYRAASREKIVESRPGLERVDVWDVASFFMWIYE